MSTLPISIRIPVADLEEIDRQARAHGITRTAFLIDGSLERLPEHRDELFTRIETLERSVERLEKLAF
jgi:hypothetical protein